MDAPFETRKRELLSECTVPPQVFDQVLPQLEAFMEPFVGSLVRKEQIAQRTRPLVSLETTQTLSTIECREAANLKQSNLWNAVRRFSTAIVLHSAKMLPKFAICTAVSENRPW
jgi:hypothetical protein